MQPSGRARLSDLMRKSCFLGIGKIEGGNGGARRRKGTDRDTNAWGIHWRHASMCEFDKRIEMDTGTGGHGLSLDPPMYDAHAGTGATRRCDSVRRVRDIHGSIWPHVAKIIARFRLIGTHRQQGGRYVSLRTNPPPKQRPQ